jgi:hypothetical protein
MDYVLPRIERGFILLVFGAVSWALVIGLARWSWSAIAMVIGANG